MEGPPTSKKPITKASGDKTLRAARVFRRRTVLKSAAALGAVAAAGPYVLGAEARAAAGELQVMIWDGYIPRAIRDKFKADTGVRIKVYHYDSNEELLNKMKATKGRGFDIVGPTLSHKPLWEPHGLLQPWDMNRVPTDKVIAAMLKASSEQWSWGGGVHHLPYIWSSEAMAWRTDLWSREYEELSYGDLWRPELKGKVQGRPHSMMTGIGLYLDRIGQLPSNRMLDAYKDEASMRRIWGGITRFAVEHKPWVKQFWRDHASQMAGFMQNGVVIGQTWAEPALQLKKEGKPVTYMAPREGAIAWLDGLSMPVGAKNPDAVYEFLRFCFTPEAGGMLGNGTRYNSAAVGADAHLDEASKKGFREAYPDDALDRLWWWPAEPDWYAPTRLEFRDRFAAA